MARPAAALLDAFGGHGIGSFNAGGAPPRTRRESTCASSRQLQRARKLSGGPDNYGLARRSRKLGGMALPAPQGSAPRRGRGVLLQGCAAVTARVRACSWRLMGARWTPPGASGGTGAASGGLGLGSRWPTATPGPAVAAEALPVRRRGRAHALMHDMTNFEKMV